MNEWMNEWTTVLLCSAVQNFDVQSLDLFADFLFHEVLELVDLDWAGRDYEATCRRFHIMPRFARNLPGLLI